MADLKEQCIYNKFPFKLGKNASEMHEMLKADSTDNAMGTNTDFCAVFSIQT
jgi:hypothetical protein